MSLRNDALVAVVRDRLKRDSRLAALAIDVYCSDGYVTLVGMVDTPAEKELVVQLISGLVGVKYVNDALVIRHSRVVVIRT